jgi:hypothetical protein
MSAESETEIGREQVRLFSHELTLSVCPDLLVRVRGADGQMLADIAATPDRALKIAALFKLAAERAAPAMAAKVVQLGSAR